MGIAQGMSKRVAELEAEVERLHAKRLAEHEQYDAWRVENERLREEMAEWEWAHAAVVELRGLVESHMDTARGQWECVAEIERLRRLAEKQDTERAYTYNKLANEYERLSDGLDHWRKRGSFAEQQWHALEAENERLHQHRLKTEEECRAALRENERLFAELTTLKAAVMRDQNKADNEALGQIERLRAALLDVEGVLIAYWTEIPEAEVERLRTLIRSLDRDMRA